MNFSQHQTDTLAFYNWLVLEPGFRQYTQERVKEMARDFPIFYADFPAAVKATLTAAMDEARREQTAMERIAGDYE